ncbi:hypothetical protein Bca4012_084582 [Brassica carinata]
MEAGLTSGFFGRVGQRRSRFGVRSGRSKWILLTSRRLAPPSRGGPVSQALEGAPGVLRSQARRFRYGFSVVGAREAVCCWSCQPSLSVLVASRAEPVSFQEHDLGLSPAHFSDVVLAFSVSWCRSMACGDLSCCRLGGISRAVLEELIIKN